MKGNNLLSAHIKGLLAQALESLDWQGFENLIGAQYNKPNQPGELSSNIAMQLANKKKQRPLSLAKLIVSHLPHSKWVADVSVAAPGFINFDLDQFAYHQVLNTIVNQPQCYGKCDIGQDRRVLVEFVSANPTGPLHVGHGRGAVVGDVMANVLAYVGFKVDREYYVNDAGRQMNILALSVWLRYLQGQGVAFDFPKKAYQGDYIHAIVLALTIDLAVLDSLKIPVFSTKDDEAIIDVWMGVATHTLGNQFEVLAQHALDYLLEGIQKDLAQAGVHFDTWLSEKGLLAGNGVEALIERLEKTGATYEKEGALWLKTTPTDDKDRVLRRANGQVTYFASDVLYHLNKFERGYDQLINIWGSDHHGYVARLGSAMKVLGKDADQIKTLLIQFVSLSKPLAKAGDTSNSVSMSTRSGNFVTLADLAHWVDKDVLRFFYIRQNIDQHMVFDVDLARTKDKDNPIFYIQYACARIHRLFEKVSNNQDEKLLDDAYRLAVEEKSLVLVLSRFPDAVNDAALSDQPFQIAHYLEAVAGEFHRFYNTHRVVGEKGDYKLHRVVLCRATLVVFSIGLKLLGIDVRQSM